MKDSNKITLLLFTICISLLFSGCDNVQSTVFEVETKDGKTLKLLCPVIDRDRSVLTYVIDQECVAIK